MNASESMGWAGSVGLKPDTEVRVGVGCATVFVAVGVGGTAVNVGGLGGGGGVTVEVGGCAGVPVGTATVLPSILYIQIPSFDPSSAWPVFMSNATSICLLRVSLGPNACQLWPPSND